MELVPDVYPDSDLQALVLGGGRPRRMHVERAARVDEREAAAAAKVVAEANEFVWSSSINSHP